MTLWWTSINKYNFKISFHFNSEIIQPPPPPLAAEIFHSMISLQFLYGFFVGEVVLFLLVVLILQRSFPRVKRPPSPSPSQKCSPSFAKDGSKVGAFEELSEFFLKIYKSPAENEKHSHITNKVVDLHQRRDEYRSFLTGFDDTIWINEAIQTAFFYYSTSESMHNSIKEGIEKSLFDAAPAFLVSRLGLSVYCRRCASLILYWGG